MIYNKPVIVASCFETTSRKAYRILGYKAAVIHISKSRRETYTINNPLKRKEAAVAATSNV